MTLEETGEIMDIIISEHPHLFAGKDDRLRDTKLALWSGMFADDDFKMVAAAVKALLMTSDEVPKVATIKAKMYQLTHPDEMTDAEAWALVSKALKRSLYNSAEEFGKLPPTLQRLVGSPSQLRDWAGMDADTVQSVVAALFQRSYRVRAATDREYAMLPQDIKSVIGSIADGLSLQEPEPPKTLHQLRQAVLEGRNEQVRQQKDHG